MDYYTKVHSAEEKNRTIKIAMRIGIQAEYLSRCKSSSLTMVIERQVKGRSNGGVN